jgi:Xaa-Pro aminopeptidase
MTMDPLIQEKVSQAVNLLAEKEIDLWLTFVRESSANGDPVLPIVYGHDVTWQSAFILTRRGDRIAIVGHYDADTTRRVPAYTEVIPYHESFRQPLLSVLERLEPAQIALNFSANDVQADGLSHGLYGLLQEYLSGTPYGARIVSAEGVIGALRGRKTETEVERIRAAVDTTYEIYRRTFDYVQLGMSEQEIGRYMHQQVAEFGVETAWEAGSCPAVNAGPDSPVGHAGPTGIQVAPGQIVHFDFGVRRDGYCADIQRVMYFRAEGENRAPEPVQRGFDTVVKAIQAAVIAMKPGMMGKEIDEIARGVITAAGYPEFKYATGHQLGRSAHDGGALLGPEWERYGDSPRQRLEAGHVYAVEPGLMVPGYGYVGIEENVLVTASGAAFLRPPQRTLTVK